MRIIAISGKARHGKDTAASILKEKLESEGYKVLVTHYGDLLKHICRSFFGWDGGKDEAGRHILQYVGTDVIKEIQPDFWVDFIVDVLRFFPSEWDYVLIPDCRFPDEISGLKSAGFDVTHLRVIRKNFESPLSAEQQKHSSETALDNYVPDYCIENSGTKEELGYIVSDWFDRYKQERICHS